MTARQSQDMPRSSVFVFISVKGRRPSFGRMCARRCNSAARVMLSFKLTATLERHSLTNCSRVFPDSAAICLQHSHGLGTAGKLRTILLYHKSHKDHNYGHYNEPRGQSQPARLCSPTARKSFFHPGIVQVGGRVLSALILIHDARRNGPVN